MTLTNQEFLRRLHKVSGNAITPLEKYKGIEVKILCRRNQNNLKWKTTPHALLRGATHPGPHSTHSYKINFANKFKQRMIKIHGNTIKLLEPYKGYDTKILCKCQICGNKWKTSPSSLLSGSGCPMCGNRKNSNSHRINNNEFEKRLCKIHSNNIINLEPYHGYHTKILCKCQICGYKWRTKPDTLLSGKGCPYCNKRSHGEQVIYHWLKYNLSKNFKYGYIIPKINLHFDFWIPSMKLAIEFDGVQHFKYVPFFDKSKPNQLNKRIHRDKQKDKYCIYHGITLIRIQNHHLGNSNWKIFKRSIYQILSYILSLYSQHKLINPIYHFNLQKSILTTN